MPYQWQTIPYPLGVAGIDQKTDAKSLPIGRPHELENVRFRKQGSLAKRNGTESEISFYPTVRNLVPYGKELIGFRDADTNIETGAAATPHQGPICPKAWAEPVDRFGVYDDLGYFTQDAQFDYAESSTLKVFVVGAPGVTTIAIVSKTRNAIVAINRFRVGYAARIMLVGSTFVIGYVNGSAELKIGTINTSTAAVTVTATLSFLNGTQTARWDWAQNGSGIVGIIFQGNTTNFGGIRILNASFAVAATADTNFTVAMTAVACCWSGSNFVVVISDNTNGLRRTAYSSAAAVTWAVATVDASIASAKEYITCAADGSSSTTAAVTIYSQESQTPAQTYNRAVAIHTTGSGGSATIGTFQSVWLASKAATPGFVVVGYATELQRCYLLMQRDGAIVARWHYREAAYNNGLNVRPTIVQSETGEFSILLPTIPGTHETSSMADAASSFSLVRWSTNAKYGPIGASSANGLMLTGGVLHRYNAGFYRSLDPAYDGAVSAAQPFVLGNGILLHPEIISAASASNGGSLSPGSVHSVIAVYMTFDERGRIIESGTSPPSSVTIGVGHNGIAVSVQNYRLQSPVRPSDAALIAVSVFRTKNGGTTYYHDTTALSAGNSTSFNLTQADTAIEDNRILYTDGGFTEHYQPSCPISLASSGHRALCIQGDKPRRVYQSKILADDVAGSFFEEKFRDVASEHPLTTVAYLDGRWFAFSQRDIFIATGDGADDSGANDSLSEFEHWSARVGCERASLIVNTTFGLMFKSPDNGFWFIGRDLQLTHLGSPIADETADVTSMVFHPDENAVYVQFETGNRAAVMTIYQTADGVDFRWSVDTGAAFYALAVLDGVLYGSAASYLVKRSTAFTDWQNSAGGIPLKITTGWIPVTSLRQGIGSVRRILALGTSKASHTVRIRVAYDYVDTWVDDKQVTSANATIGSSAWQWELRCSRQKVQAVKIEISDVNSTTDSFELNEIALEVGMKPGAPKLRSEKRAV
jgi:hypothetical protein